MTKVADERREEKIVEGCQVYARAAERAKAGERTISMDELTGVQALERKYPDLSMLSGHVLRREFESSRHGTLSWFINFDVVTGWIIEPSWGATRNEEDALAHIERLIASDPLATKWHLVLDNLNIHQSEALVRWVAQREGMAQEMLGAKARVASYARWKVVLRSCTIQLIRWSFTTRAIHACWMNQVEIWLSILVRKLLKRGNFSPMDHLRDQILAFIAYYNCTMAKPVKWTYTGLTSSWKASIV